MSTLNEKINTLKDLLQHIEAQHPSAALATSFGVEDMLLTDMIHRYSPGLGVFTLDTGRLPAETYELMQNTRQKYGDIYQVYSPQAESLQEYVRENGPNAFYDSVELRKQCCYIRKLEPLQRALEGREAWITGLRREQSVTRVNVAIQEWDDGHAIHKFNPLLEWTEREVWDYIKEFEVPYNTLHDKHYPSIGCAPCTRAIAVGEDIRAGRWWWENPELKECGLHVKKAS